MKARIPGRLNQSDDGANYYRSRATAMDNNVANVLTELRQDHRNMGLMLNLLEQESNRLFDGDDTDFELLHDVMHYMTVYPDTVHHPKEDRIYAELKAGRSQLRSVCVPRRPFLLCGETGRVLPIACGRAGY